MRLGLGPRVNAPGDGRFLPGQTLKQVVECVETGSVRAWVRLEALPPEDLLAHLAGTQSALILRTDTMQDLTIIPGAGGPEQTAFGIVADLVSIARGLTRFVEVSREEIGALSMLIPYSWLKSYVDIDLPAEELAERLTMSGLEVDRLEYGRAQSRDW